VDERIKSIDPFSGVVTEGRPYTFVPDVALDALSAGSSLPPMVRKGWVVIHFAEPATRELNMQTLGQGGGMLCMAELRSTVLTFYEGVSGVMMNRVFAIDLSKYSAWSQVGQSRPQALPSPVTHRPRSRLLPRHLHPISNESQAMHIRALPAA
jgi:hypothetical protein